MISLRLPPETESLLSVIALREQVSRSEWIRRLIDRQLETLNTPDPHAHYVKLTADLSVMSKAVKRVGAAQHSAALRGNPQLDRRGSKAA